DYEGAQYPLTQVRPGAPNFTAIFNIDEEIYGAEFETSWVPMDSLRFNINYSYLHSKFTDKNLYFDAITNTAVSLDGNTVPASPENKVLFNVLYRLDFAPGSLTMSGTWSWRDEVGSSAFANPGFVSPAYDTTDFRVT